MTLRCEDTHLRAAVAAWRGWSTMRACTARLTTACNARQALRRGYSRLRSHAASMSMEARSLQHALLIDGCRRWRIGIAAATESAARACIHHSLVATHVSPGSRPIQRANMVLAWQQLGFVAGGDGFTFCRVEDEDTVTLPLYEGAEDESEDEVSNDVQDFIVNDADGEALQVLHGQVIFPQVW